MELLHNEPRFNTKKLLLALLKTTSSGWIPSSHFEKMSRGFGIPDGEATIFFLTGLMQIIRDLPLKIFDDITTRSVVLESIQEALDNVIDRLEQNHNNAN